MLNFKLKLIEVLYSNMLIFDNFIGYIPMLFEKITF